MGAFKLDLMTLLVLFVVISVVFTMTTGSKETKSAAPATTVGKPLVQGFSNVNAGNFSSTGYRSSSQKISRSRFTGKTWN